MLSEFSHPFSLIPLHHVTCSLTLSGGGETENKNKTPELCFLLQQ